MKVNDIKEGLKDPKDNPCWKGYKPVGTKKKGGKTVPNCVPKEDVEEAFGRRSSYYNPMDYERDQQRQMDYEKRAFKRAELQHELGHEDDPDFERNLRQQQMDRDRGPWYLKVNGKILKSRGEVKVFDWKKGANNYALAILKNKPELQGKIFLTKKNEDDAVEAVSKEKEDEFHTKLDNLVHDTFGKRKDEGSEILKVQKDDDKATVLVDPRTNVQTQIDKTNPNAPRLTQDEQGKLKLISPAQGQQNSPDQKPNLVGKDVTVSTEDSSVSGHEVTDTNTRSAITGDEDHDEITKLLVQRLRKLSGVDRMTDESAEGQPPKMPDVQGLTPGQSKDLGNGERVSLKQDGTVSYSGGFGEYIYDKTGKAIKYNSPTFGGLSQSNDLATGGTTKNYNAGPMNISQTTDKAGNVVKSKANYDVGLGVMGREQENGITTKSWTPRVAGEDPVTQKDMYAQGNKDKEATYDRAMKQVNRESKSQRVDSLKQPLDNMLRIARLR